MSQHTQLNEPEIRAERYVFGLMDAQEKAAFEQVMQGDTRLQKQVNDFQNHMLSLTDQLPTAPLPQAFSANVERRLDALEQPRTVTKKAPAQAVMTRFWQSLPLWRGVALAGVMSSLLLSLPLLHSMNQPTENTTYIAVMVEPNDKAPGWVIQAGQNKKIQLIPLAAVEIPQGKALQFWTKADGWSAPVSLGLLKTGQRLEVDIEDLPPLKPNQLFELTLEDENGSPTGKPTGPIYSIGRGKPAI